MTTSVPELFQVKSEGRDLVSFLWCQLFVFYKRLIHLEKTTKGRKERKKERKILIEKLGCGMPGSNWRPPDYETDALTNWANPATRIRVDGRFPAYSMLIREIVQYIASDDYTYRDTITRDKASLWWGVSIRRFFEGGKLFTDATETEHDHNVPLNNIFYIDPKSYFCFE